jgi:hypothetical protein
MGVLVDPLSAKLFVGMLSGNAALFDACAHSLEADYGPVELESERTLWTYSNYYRDEMGPGLFRKFLCFERLIDPGILSSVKQRTTQLEASLAVNRASGKKRTINLDPGYVTESKVVLATTKDYSHRIYIGNRIYAEVTLRYRREMRTFVALEHTYPDFRSRKTQEWFVRVREYLRASLRR